MTINNKTTFAQDVDRLQEISNLIDGLTLEIKEVNSELKRLEVLKEELRSRFFILVNEHIELSGTMATQVILIKFASRAEAESYVEDNHPGWRVVQYNTDKIVIEEDPSQMKFEWTTDDGYRIGRTTAVVGTKFNFDMLRSQQPELFDEVVDVKTVYELNEKKTQKIIEEHPEFLSLLQDATQFGKIQLRMSSPKKVVDE